MEEMIEGLAVLSPGAMRLPGYKVMIRADSEKVRGLQVAVISGGGSGHEPGPANADPCWWSRTIRVISRRRSRALKVSPSR